MTYIVFIEYQIQKEKWEEFKQLIPHIKETIKSMGMIQNHSFLTGREQPYLVVEVIEVADEQVTERIYHQRRVKTDGLNLSLFPLIDTERTNIHVWTFEPIG